MTTENLWSTEINVSSKSTPKMLMKKQAADLGVITKNIVEADVTTVIDDGEYYHSFSLIAPLLNYERLILFDVGQPLIGEYPLTVSETYTDEHHSCENIEEFSNCLKQILSSKEVVAIINSLIAQSS